MSFCMQGLPGVAESTVTLSERKLSPWGEGARQGGWGVWEIALPRPSPTVCNGPPSPGARGLTTRTWILRLLLRLRSEWQFGTMHRRVKVFGLRKPNERKSDAVPIVFGMMLWVLALEWCFSYWLLIDVCIGFGLIHVLSIERKRILVCSSSRNTLMNWILLPISPHSHVILHAWLARSCRIHCHT